MNLCWSVLVLFVSSFFFSFGDICVRFTPPRLALYLLAGQGKDHISKDLRATIDFIANQLKCYFRGLRDTGTNKCN